MNLKKVYRLVVGWGDYEGETTYWLDLDALLAYANQDAGRAIEWDGNPAGWGYFTGHVKGRGFTSYHWTSHILRSGNGSAQ